MLGEGMKDNRRGGVSPVIAALALLACFAFDCPAAVRVAVILPETSRLAATAAGMRAAFELAMEQIPKQRGIDLKLLLVDDYGRPDSARVVAERLAKYPDVVAWMGGYPSSCCVEIAGIARQNAIPYLIVSASSDTLTRGLGKNVFRLAPPTTDYNDGLLDWAEDVIGSRRPLAVVYDVHSSWAEAVVDLREDLASRWQGTVNYLSFSAGERDFGALTDELKRLEPAGVWLLGGTGDIARFLRQCRSVDWAPAAFIAGAVPMVNRPLISASEGAADYLFGPAIWWPTHSYTGVDQFTRDFLEQYGEVPDYRAAQSYAAVQIISDAIARSSEIDKNSIRKALLETDLVTVFGRVRFEDYRGFSRQNRVKTSVLQLQGEYWRTVWPLHMAEAKYIYPVPDWRDREKRQFTRHRRYLLDLLFLMVTGMLLVSVATKRKELLRRLGRNGR